MLIDLNFLSLETSSFTIPVFRSKFNGEPRQDGYFAARLPVSQNEGCDSEYAYYRVSLSCYHGSGAYSFRAEKNPQLMTSIIWYHLKQWAQRLVSEKRIQADIIDHFDKFVSFIVEDLSKGQRVIRAYPYYLSVTGQYGILLDFVFRKKPDVPFGREVQQLSFSLDRAGKSNANSYLDRLNYIHGFIQNRFSKLGALPICGNSYNFSTELVRLQGQELNSRTYIFRNEQENYDKIQGVKTHPYALPPKELLFVFVFKESERASGNELFRALIGKGYPSTFSGMKAWFDCDINTNNVTRITVDFDSDTSASAWLASQLKDVIDRNPDKQIIGLFIDSYSHYDKRSENYTKAKQVFFSMGVPLQVVRNDRIIQSDGLKWAISGIGLQVFSKLGGIPWLVKPSANNCLIFGIGKAHDLQWQNGRTVVKKYFAYSVCFDSTGVYRSLGVLCDTEDRKQYYTDLERNIISQIEARISAGQTITDCVIHTPFRMRNDEMKTIKNSIEKLSQTHGSIAFAVMRINTHNRFFGFADNNIKIPYESTYVQLSVKEYLVWFEGLKRGKEYINKRVANPTYIDFWYGWDDQAKVIQLLQDVVNLAGASWRGFNAKLEPISIFYPQLIAGFIRDFRKLGGGQDIGKTLAQFNTPFYNPNFNYGEFAIIRNQAGLNSYKISVKEWVEKTNAIGLKATAGRYGGTYAHKDIAFEFGMWISAEFKIYLIKEFQRLKDQELKQLGWDIRRNLSKINYRIHTDAIRENLIPPELTKAQANLVYASEADVLNMALFGMTAKDWRDANPDKKGNIRDYADVSQLVCLSNLENLNAHFINDGLSQEERLVKLNKTAIHQMKLLTEDHQINELGVRETASGHE